MVDKLKKWYKSPQGIGFSSAFFGVILTLSLDILRDRPVFSTIISVFNFLMNNLLIFLSFELRVWWLLLAVAGIVLISIILIKLNSPEREMYAKILKAIDYRAIGVAMV